MKKTIAIILILFTTIVPSLSATTNVKVSEQISLIAGYSMRTLENVHGSHDTVGSAKLTNDTTYDEYAHVEQYHAVTGADESVCFNKKMTYNPGDYAYCEYTGASVANDVTYAWIGYYDDGYYTSILSTYRVI